MTSEGRHQIGCVGCAEARRRIPSLDSRVTGDMSTAIGVVPGSNIKEILAIGTRCCQLIERGIDEAERMSGHLIGHGYNARP